MNMIKLNFNNELSSTVEEKKYLEEIEGHLKSLDMAASNFDQEKERLDKFNNNMSDGDIAYHKRQFDEYKAHIEEHLKKKFTKDVLSDVEKATDVNQLKEIASDIKEKFENTNKFGKEKLVTYGKEIAMGNLDLLEGKVKLSVNEKNYIGELDTKARKINNVRDMMELLKEIQEYSKSNGVDEKITKNPKGVSKIEQNLKAVNPFSGVQMSNVTIPDAKDRNLFQTMIKGQKGLKDLHVSSSQWESMKK